MDQANHVPVLYKEVLELLKPQPGGHYIDGTLGAGGHTKGLLEASAPDGRVLAFDRDPEAIAFTRSRLQAYDERITYVNDSYAAMGEIAPVYGFGSADGILLDLGLSSRQLADSARGFSFMREGPLDMRFDPALELTAADLINNLSEDELVTILSQYGEVRKANTIARVIAANRPFRTTTELAELIKSEVRTGGRIHPATQVFQALRIAVNDELGELEKGLFAALDVLASGGRLAIISFHSLEDRFVKHTFRELSKDCVCPPEQVICTCDAKAVVRLPSRRAVQASVEEIAFNPRSRSARLRVAEKI